MNTYYKAQIRFTSAAAPAPPTKTVDGVVTYPIATWINDNLHLFSEWSTVCLLRPISKPVLSLNGFETDTKEATFTLGNIWLVGSVSFEDSDTEYLTGLKKSIKIYEDLLTQTDIKIITVFDDNYPIKLNVMNENRPLVIYAKGNDILLNKSNMAIMVHENLRIVSKNLKVEDFKEINIL